jgi:regulatory protein
MTASKKPPGRERIQQRLTNKMTHYLARYASTRARLASVLRRFARRKLAEADPAEIEAAIETVIGQAEQQGWLDEAAFASQKVRAGRLAGRSGRALQSKLYQAGLPAEKIAAALAEQTETQTDAELAAALIFARKRRIGPFARQPASQSDPADQQRQQRDMGRLARAGFSQQICRTVLEITDPQSAEQQLAEASTLPEPGSLG